ncbi:MAG TPA: adenylate/guanylate cyclase domain-containing protein [Acidimicrobiia bacterium]|nr:adenylate/guanylate cyclase domain-containing protein [Acidimicrobiia bacterium]
MTRLIDRGGLDPLSLSFLDAELERAYQREEGSAGLAGYRIITGATLVLWAIAAVLLPLGTGIRPALSYTVGGLMAVLGGICLAASRWATTMNRQHLLASLLTTANGFLILLLSEAGNVLEGYAVGAIMLLFLFGFVSRTRFIYAAIRTFVIAIGLAVAVVLYDGPGSLLIDAFIFLAAAAGSLLGLRVLERNRRQVWLQHLIIAEQMVALGSEQAQSERLLLNVLPASVSARLRHGENPIADTFPSVTILFADLVGFTPMASAMDATEVISMLSAVFTHFDDLVSERQLEKIKTIGDAYMAVGGLPEPLAQHAERMIDLGFAMLDCTKPGGRFSHLQLRIGIHSGPVAGGVIGTRRFAYDVWGDTVNLASRLQETGVTGRIHVSGETMSLAGDGYSFEPRGLIELRGHGTMETYLVIDSVPDASQAPPVASSAWTPPG